MNTIHYFKHEDGMRWVSVAAGQFEECVTLWGNDQLGDAFIELRLASNANTAYYVRPGSNYQACSQEEYLIARATTQAAIARFSAFFLVKINPTPEPAELESTI